MDTQKIVENIQRICKERGTNPTVAGEKSGAGKSLVTQLKTRGIMPSIEKFKMLAEYLGVTTSELLGEVPISSDPEQAARDALTEQLAQSVREQLSEEKKPTPNDGDRLIMESAIRLHNWFHSLPLEKQKALLELGGGPGDLAE